MMISSSHRRLLVFAATIFFISSVWLCTSRLFSMSFTPAPENAPRPEANQEIDVKLNHADLPMSYGNFDRPDLDGLELLGNLPDEYVPTLENKRRLIVIGDIHGMDTALQALLKKIEFDMERDHIITTGDMINKGPDSVDVLERLMSLKASAVRGNHEDRVLLSRAEIDGQYGVSADLDTTQVEDRKGQLSDLVTARLLSQDQVDWLTKLPLVLTVEPLGIRVVHAGLMPGVDLDKQDPWAVMNMRTLVYPREQIREKEGEEAFTRRRRVRRDEDIDVPEASSVPQQLDQGTPTMDEDEDVDESTATFEGHAKDINDHGEDDEVDTSPIGFDREVAVPSSGSDGEMWGEAWDKHQKRLQKEERYTVIYGHDARTGYKEGKYTIGLDSGCVKGDALTALIIEAKEGGGFKRLTSQVQCNST